MLERLREKRKKLHWTEKEAAKRIGISQPFYHNIETGKKTPSLPTTLKITDAMGCTLEELTARKEAQQHDPG